jgi:hypothetical protein
MTQLRRVVTIAATPDEVADRWPAPDVQRRVWAHAADLEGVGTFRAHPAPRDLGSEVSLTIETADGGALPAGVTSASVFEALHRFKALVEAGEIPTLDRNPHARHSGPDPH